MSRPLSPQEKKLLSYERERRNSYGENDKASRKTIPFRKRQVNRSYRRATNKELPRQLVTTSSDELLAVENRVLSVRRSTWTKSPDIPLRDFVAKQAFLRQVRQGRKTASVERLKLDREN